MVTNRCERQLNIDEEATASGSSSNALHPRKRIKRVAATTEKIAESQKKAKSEPVKSMTMKHDLYHKALPDLYRSTCLGQRGLPRGYLNSLSCWNKFATAFNAIINASRKVGDEEVNFTGIDCQRYLLHLLKHQKRSFSEGDKVNSTSFRESESNSKRSKSSTEERSTGAIGLIPQTALSRDDQLECLTRIFTGMVTRKELKANDANKLFNHCRSEDFLISMFLMMEPADRLSVAQDMLSEF